MRLERPAAMNRFDSPLTNLDLLLDVDHACDLEDEARDRERILECPARFRLEQRRIFDEGHFAFVVVAKREMAVRLRPWKALAKPHAHALAVHDCTQPSVRAHSEHERVVILNRSVAGAPSSAGSAKDLLFPSVILSAAEDLLFILLHDSTSL